jgi:hypothetical protein
MSSLEERKSSEGDFSLTGCKQKKNQNRVPAKER